MDEKTAAYNLRIPVELKERTEQEAKKEKRSLNKHIIHIIESHFVAKQKIKGIGEKNFSSSGIDLVS